jgi:hypothetical protein
MAYNLRKTDRSTQFKHSDFGITKVKLLLVFTWLNGEKTG